jgi:disulfide bond formation protein DsbB
MINNTSNTKFFVKFNFLGLLLCVLSCIGVLSYALYLQHYHDLAPCPLCIMQRYAFILVAIFCGWALFTRKRRQMIAVFCAMVSAMIGTGIAAYHIWLKSNPSISCGIDPLETALNKTYLADWLPSIFYADGLCSAEHAPILGLFIPQWSLISFVSLTSVLLLLLITALENSRRSLVSH